MKKLFNAVTLFLTVFLLASLSACSPSVKTVQKPQNTASGEYAGQTVILHTNDVHGAVEGYSYLPALKASIEAQGGTVILVDAGDYTNGSVYVSVSKGESAVTLMNQVGYDISALGNHEFDFGFEQLQENLKNAQYNVLCANITKDGKLIFDSEIIYQVGSLKIGFFALSTPEIQTKVNPALIQGLNFTEKEGLYKTAQQEADKLSKKCDIVICLAHLGIDGETEGNRSTDVMANVTGIDFLIDGHSHSVIANGDLEAPIQQTGTGFANIGFIAIDNATKKIVRSGLISTEGLSQDAEVLATAKNIIDTVDAEYGAVFATTEYVLEGKKLMVRTQETNLGNLLTDAMLWTVSNEAELTVDAAHTVVVTHGGGIRASVVVGGISRSAIKEVLPFGNTIAVNYVSGAELLEALEVSTYCTPESVAGFPHVAGMKITIDTTKEYDAGEEYPDSTYCAPKSIQRVTIDEINGQPFDPSATYAVITNNFTAAGGDTYYAFKRAYDAGNGFDTAITMDDALANYIRIELGGEIPEKYAEPQGRVTVK